MHELSLAGGVVDIVVEEARRHGMERSSCNSNPSKVNKQCKEPLPLPLPSLPSSP